MKEQRTVDLEYLSSFLKETESGCLEWTRGRDNDGYGCVWMLGKTKKVHRLMWEFTNGELPKDVCVLHRCDNPACCNPNHLFTGSVKDNSVDMVSKGRSAKGSKDANSVLTEEQVSEIRKEYVRGSSKHGSGSLAKKYGVHFHTILFIVNGKTWRHVQ
jgi:hypothetical protein